MTPNFRWRNVRKVLAFLFWFYVVCFLLFVLIGGDRARRPAKARTPLHRSLTSPNP